MSIISSPPKQLTKKIKQAAYFGQRYKVLLLLVVVAVAVGYTTLKSQSYLSPVRNETAYTDKTTELTNFKTIDVKFAQELQNSTDDIEVTVDASLPDDRSNPFTE